MTIFNLSGETNERDRLLSLLMEWTTEPRLITAMVMNGLADFPGIATLAAMVRATLDASEIASEAPKEGEAQPLSERQIAAAILAFLGEAEIRNTVARYVAQVHGDTVAPVQGESKYDAAKRDLYELRVHLQSTHHIQPAEIPNLCMGDPEQQAEIMQRLMLERGLTNPAMSWPVGEPKPDWVTAWEQDDYPMPEGAAELLRAMRPEAQEVAKQFPPMSLVRATRDGLVCPAPGLLAIVRGYDVEDGEIVVHVGGWADADTPKIGARPAWLELVATRGGVTREAVSALFFDTAGVS